MGSFVDAGKSWRSWPHHVTGNVRTTEYNFAAVRAVLEVLPTVQYKMIISNSEQMGITCTLVQSLDLTPLSDLRICAVKR